MKKLLLALGILALICSSPAMAARNANGAMLLHTNDAVVYSPGWGYCGDDALNPPLPPTCNDLVTQTNRDPANEYVPIWMVAAFADNASPAVTAYQVGIYGDIPVGYYDAWGYCPTSGLQVADPTWPAPGSGTAVGFTAGAITNHLWKMYWFGASAPGVGSIIRTGTYPNGQDGAGWADDSAPPLFDACTRFGSVGWGVPGSKDCPTSVVTGACCFTDGHCEYLDQTACTGQFMGAGVLCDPNPCQQPLGACCFTDGHCTDLLAVDCTAQGGAWQGFGTDCATFQCPQPQPEACCFADGTCQNLLADACRAAGGTPEGVGTSCETFNCPQPPTGACCIGVDCTITTQANCSGTYMGDGTLCDPNPCATPTKSTTWGQIKGQYR